MHSTIENLVNFSYETSNTATCLLTFPSCRYRISRSRPTCERMCFGSALAHPRETPASGIRVCARETFDGTGVPMCALPLKRPVENWFCHPRATPGNEMARQIARSCKHSPASRASAACPPDAPPAGVVSRIDSDTCHGFGNSSRAHFVDTRFEDARPRVGLASNLRSRVLKAFDPFGMPSE